MARPYRDESWLRERYRDNGQTQAEIADECGVTPRCIRKWMQKFGIETRDVKGENHGLYGEERDEETKRRISETLEGRTFDEQTKRRISEAQRGRTLRDATLSQISDSLTGREKSQDTRRRMSEAMTGEQNPNWKGGYFRRYGDGWTVARERALDRDEVCQYCGEDGSELTLDVHHIVPVRAFHEAPEKSPKDAHELDNLVVLCKRCHALVEHGTIDVPSP